MLYSITEICPEGDFKSCLLEIGYQVAVLGGGKLVGCFM